MTDPAREAVEAARGYDSLLVPALFREWSTPVLDAAAVKEGDQVLDVACGTGVLARTALARVGKQGAVTGVDPAPGMRAVAEETEPRVTWIEGAAEALPVEDGAFDVVVSQFGMMFFPDRVQAAREMLRALRPAGRLAVAVWDELKNNPAYRDEVEVLDRVAGRAAGDAVRIPYNLGDVDELRGPFAEAGAHDIEVRTLDGIGRYANVRTMVGADLHGWLPLMGVHLDADTIERTLGEAEAALAPYLCEDGSLRFPTRAHILTARA